MLLAIVAQRATPTNLALAAAAPPWVDARIRRALGARDARRARGARAQPRGRAPRCTRALALVVWAAASAGTELVGVDLLPDGAGGWTVLELNGAVDFTAEYRIDRDPFVAAATELARAARDGNPAFAAA